MSLEETKHVLSYAAAYNVRKSTRGLFSWATSGRTFEFKCFIREICFKYGEFYSIRCVQSDSSMTFNIALLLFC